METFRLLIDFGLVVLIWIVQLVIYPLFKEIKPSIFIQWHQKYTRTISIVVFPLMVSQVIIYLLFLLDNPSPDIILIGILIILLWAHTFLIAVPIHQRLNQPKHQNVQFNRLVRTNWWRVIGWNLIFLISIVTFWS